MKKFFIIALVVLLVCGIGAAAVFYYHQAKYITIGDQVIARDATYLNLHDEPLAEPEKLAELKQLTQLDLLGTGITTEQYLWLKDRLPNCQISWSVPFQGQYYQNETSLLRITQLSQADIDQLVYFPNLAQIDAPDCRDYAALQALKARYPQCYVRYQIALGDQKLEPTVTELTLNDPDISELEEALPYLPELQAVTLTGALPGNEAIHKLQLAYPGITFIWRFTLCGVEVTSQDTLVDLSNIPMESTQEVEAALGYFNNLERVIMCDCGISNEEMDAMGQRNPNVRFVWTVSLGPNIRLRTDASYFMPYQYRCSFTDKDTANLKYCIDLICLDIGHFPISDVSFLAYMPHMKYLIIALTNVTDISAMTGMQELEYAELFTTGIEDYSPLLTCPNLRDLNICYATPKDCSVLCQLTQLENLYIKEWTPVPYIDELKAALPHVNIVYKSKESPSSTADGWRNLPRYYQMRDVLGMFYLKG